MQLAWQISLSGIESIGWMRNEVVVRTMSKVACTIQRWRFIFTLLHERGIYPSGRASLIDLRRTEHVWSEEYLDVINRLTKWV